MKISVFHIFPLQLDQKINPQNERKVSVNYVSNKGLISKTYQKFIQLSTKTIRTTTRNNLILKMTVSGTWVVQSSKHPTLA